MTDTKNPQSDVDKVRDEAHKKNLAYDPTKPEESPADKRLKELNKRREEEYKQDAEAAKKDRPQQSPQTQGPGGGMAAGSGYRQGQTQEEIESPVQAMRDPRTDFTTTNVDSGGDKLDRRGGKPASPEEKKAWGDKVPEGDSPYTGGVPGSHPPGSSGPSKEEKEKEAKQLRQMRGEEPADEAPKGAAPAPQPGSGSKKP